MVIPPFSPAYGPGLGRVHNAPSPPATGLAHQVMPAFSVVPGAPGTRHKPKAPHVPPGRVPAPPPVPVGAYDVFGDPQPAIVQGVGNAAIHGAVDLIAPVIDHRLPRQVKNAPSTKWGLYWESHRVWRDWVNNRLQKKKGKALKPRPKKAGFYYENEEDWSNWLATRDIDAHYKPRVLLHHQHVSHDRIHDNIDIHTGHHMLEAYVHLRATKKNILYLAHVLKEQKGRLYTIGDKHKPKFLMDLHEGDKYSE